MNTKALVMGRLPAPAQALLALLLALGLNLMLIRGILLLNRAARARAPQDTERIQTRILNLPSESQPLPPEPVELPEQEQPLMRVDLDLSEPPEAPAELPKLSLDLQLPYPTIATGGVPVVSRATVHRADPARPGSGSPEQAGPLDASQVDQAPRELDSSPKPNYPRIAQRRRIEGLVTIELLIDTNGRVRDSRNSAGDPMLVKAVLEVLPKLRFAPAQNRGETVSVWGRKTFRFQLPPRR